MTDLFTDTSDWTKEQVEFLNTGELANISSHMNKFNYTLTDNSGWQTHHMVIIVTFPIIFMIGTIGNLLIFIVMHRGSLKHSSTCFYMAILALADICKLIFFKLAFCIHSFWNYIVRIYLIISVHTRVNI